MKKWVGFAAAMALVLVLAACGSKNDGGAKPDNSQAPTNTEQSEASNDVKIIASDWEFDKQEYKVKAGEEVKITLQNAKGKHGIAIKNTDYKLEDKQTVTAKFDEPGTYEIFCNIPCGAGHAKMKANLIVE